MKPRVLMIAYACNPEGGGEHWLGWGWAEEAAKNYSVHLLTTTNHRSQVEKHASPRGITPHFVSLPDGLRNVSERLGGAGRWLRKIAWQSRAAKLAKTLHAREKFQIVHQTTFHTFRVPFPASRLDIPSVWGPVAGGESVPAGFGRELGAARFGETGRRLGNRLWLLFPPVRHSLTRAGVIFVSNRTTLEFLPGDVRGKCVIVPPNALRPEDETLHPSCSFSCSNSGGRSEGEGGSGSERGRKEEGGEADSLLHLLYVGNCVATRAVPLVFEALRHSGLKKVRLTIVGSGPALARWRRLAEKFGLVENVEFTGQVARDQLPALYGRADALVFPALRDSGGSALLEAMARGVPVICLDWGGPGEMVDANSGVKIPVRDRAETVAGLAAAIARLQALPALRLALARAARERALAHFRWEAKARILNATYQRLLATS
jgi:glycosyltransferase involved in cell wall biosynthesis